MSNFIKKNDYPFHVLIDPEKEDNTGYKTAEAFGISGIPTKIILGPDGKIKFKAVGYSGNNEKLVKELGYMIEMSQKTQTEEPQA